MTFKIIKNIEEINFLESITPKNLYCIGFESYNYHRDIYDTDYYYYVIYDNEIIKVPFVVFKQILNRFNYDIEETRWHYQTDIIETEWKNDYPENFKVVEDGKYSSTDIEDIIDIFDLQIKSYEKGN